MAVDVLSILLLGSPSITWRDIPFQIARRQARALLYRLAVSIEPVSRQQLCFLFWPDLPEARARRNLNRLLSYLHQSLPHRELLNLSDETTQLNPHLTRSDTDEFQKFLQNEQATGMQRAIDLYRGSFLQGFYLPHSPEYDF
jgi:DNA-binding SARP family transcriptional activator